MTDSEKRRNDNERIEEMLTEALDFMIADPTFPEWYKVDTRIARVVCRLKDKILDLALTARPAASEAEAKELYPKKKALLEYLTLVGVGIDQFVAQMDKKDGSS